ncbi:MAG: glutaredoxin family protein [Archangium sp.]
MPAQIDVYRKAGCQMCDDAADLLADFRREWAFDVTEHNIQADAALFQKYRYRVPVVVIDGIERLELRFDQRQLEAAFQAARVPRRE